MLPHATQHAMAHQMPLYPLHTHARAHTPHPQGHEFELAVRYGEHVSAVFVALVLSGGSPLVIISCAVSFLAHYWLEKYELIRVSGGA